MGGARRNGRGSGPVSRLLLGFICVEVLIIEMTLTARQTGQTSQAGREAGRQAACATPPEAMEQLPASRTAVGGARNTL